MRIDTPEIAAARGAQSQEWRYALQIMFATSSPTITSRDGIANLPGTPIEGVIKSISSRSQQVWPDEGRTTIGQITVDILDIAEALTDELRDQLHNDDAGIRDKEIRVFAGVGDDFNNFTRVATAFVDGCQYENGVYTIVARDRTRELRDKILEPKKTRLSAALTVDATTLSVRDTTDFELVQHGPSFADAPSATVGYLRYRKTGEIMRYTGKTSTTFTGVTRGVFRTRPSVIEFNGTDPVERWPEIEEYIYIELPGPAMAIALATGVLDVTASPAPMLPDHWHLGMDWANAFDVPSWLNIGGDLWNPADYSVGFPIRFAGFKSDTDGKKLIEGDVLRLLGLYAPTTPSGLISLRRVARITATQGYIAELNADNVVSHGALRYDLAAVRNQYQVKYNYDGEEFTRAMAVVDAGSIARNGETTTTTLEFRGLTTERHTERLIREQLQAMGDRYAEPPLVFQQVKCTPNMNFLEIGDTVRVRLSSVQNHVSVGAGTLDQTFEVQRTDINWTTGEVTLSLFASGRLIERTGGNELPDAVLADSWYTSTGTNMTTLTGYVAGSPARLTANVTLTGTADINAAGSIWYHDGDLTIDAGVTVTIQNQAQLRVRGFLSNAGTIDGAGRGYAGGADPDTTLGTSTGWIHELGTAGYLGPTRSGAGMCFFYSDGGDAEHYRPVDGAVTEGLSRSTAAPFLSLVTDDAGALVSRFPPDLRGTSGAPGGQVVNQTTLSAPIGTGGTVGRKGGTGGASGAGLAIVCRGLGFSTAGVIDLSGADGALGEQGGTPDIYDVDGTIHWDLAERAGSGAGGMPGALYILLDGDGVPYPDINPLTIELSAGDTPIDGYGAVSVEVGRFRQSSVTYNIPSMRWPTDVPMDGDGLSPRPCFTGLNRYAFVSGNLWAAASMVQYIPATGDGSPEVVPAPSSLSVTGNAGFTSLRWSVGPEWQAVEIFASATNDRAFAEEVGEVDADHFNHSLPDGGGRYYWVRGIAGSGADRRVSSWFPDSATAGVYGSASPSGLAWNITASNGRAWVGNAATSPITWEPTGVTTDITADMLRFGSLLDREIVRVTLNTTSGALTWASVVDDTDIVTTASATPANTITFTFTHTPSGLVTTETVVAVTSGGAGLPGPPGADGADGAPGTDGVDGSDGADGADGAPASRILSVRKNRSDMSATVVNGSLYVHGFDSLGNPIAGPGEIAFDGVPVAVPNGAISTSQDVLEGWILLETNTGSSPFASSRIGAARKSRAGWVYDNGSAWASFTATSTMVAIGSYARASGAISVAIILGNGLVLSAIPYENAHQVYAGDLQAGAVDDLAAFSSTLRPVAVVSSLPALPSSSYPDGALVYLTSDKKVYRADYSVSPDTWIASVDGADIVAGTITAAALAADIVLATLFRTAGSGTRVELEGGGHDFPFWIGSGTKGSASGSPGSGAKVYYDADADEFVVSGRIEASVFQTTESAQAVSVVSSGGLACNTVALVSSSGTGGGGASLSTTYTTIMTGNPVYHPSNSGVGSSATNRLASVQQPFFVDFSLEAHRDPAGSAGIIWFKIQYEYDASGTWSDLATFGKWVRDFTAMGAGGPYQALVKAKASGWSSTIRFRVQAKLDTGSAGDGYADASMTAMLFNVGSGGGSSTLT